MVDFNAAARKEKFLNLYKRFGEGIKWINEMLIKGDNPWLRREIERFNEKVIAPMDEAWAAMPEAEKAKIEPMLIRN